MASTRLKTITKECLECGEPFEASLKEHNRGYAKFCTQTCSSIHNGRKLKRPPNMTCAACGTEFFGGGAAKAAHSRSGLRFCSRKCKDTAQRIGGLEAIQPDHYGTGTGEKIYRTRAFETYEHRCIDCGYDRYDDVLQVHHLDCDRTNNTPSNWVIVCPTCHTERHWGLRPNVNYEGLKIPMRSRKA